MSEQNLVVAVRLKADGSGLVGQLRPAIDTMDELRAATSAVGAAAAPAATGTASMGKAAATAGAEVGQASASVKELGSQLGQAQVAAASMADGVGVLETRLGAASTAHAAAGRSTGAHRAAMQDLSYQLQDVGAQLSSGTSLLRIFGQQSGQFFDALNRIALAGGGAGKGIKETGEASEAAGVDIDGMGEKVQGVAEKAENMGGKFGAVAGFLAGPWGAAITVGVGLLAPLIGKLFEGGTAAKKMEDVTLQLEDALRKQALATDAARKALADYNTQQEAARKQDSLSIGISLARADADLKRATATRELLKATLEATRAAMVKDMQDGSSPDPNRQFRIARYSSAITGLDAQIGAQDSAIGQLEQTQRNLFIADARRTAAEAVDPVKRLNDQYDRMADKAVRAAAANSALAKSLAATLTGIEHQRKAAIDAEEDRQRSADRQGREDARAGTLTSFLRPVDGVVTSGFHARGGEHEGVDLRAAVGTPIRAPAAGTVDVAGVRQGYGNAIYINFGGGTSGRFGHLSKFNVKPGDHVDAGDIIGYTGGAVGADGAGDSTGAHLHYEVRRNGRAVDPLTGRYPADAGAAGDDAARQGDRRQREAEAAAKRVAEANQRAANELDRINVAWGEQPTLIKRAAEDQQKLQVIIDAYKDKTDATSVAIVARAREEQRAIEDGKVRPLNDYLRAQGEDLRVGALILSGRQDEADAQRVIIGLERQMGPLTTAQKAEVLATVDALDAQGRAIDVMRQKQGLYLDALGDMKGIVAEATDAFVRGDLGQLIRSPKKLIDAFTQFQGKLLFDKLFGDTFRKLEDQVTGRDKVGNAADLMAGAVRRVADQTDVTAGAFSDAADAASGLAGSLRGATAPGGRGDPRALGAMVGGLTPESEAEQDAPTGPEVVVTGPRTGGIPGGTDLNVPALKTTLDGLLGTLKGRLPPPKSAEDLYGSGLGKVAQSVAGLFTNPEHAEKIGAAIGKFSGKALAGAATGQFVSGIANTLGIHLNQTGSSIGGAIGGVTGLPGGAIIGSLLGGAIGSLFGHKATDGSAGISTANGQFTAGTGTGASAALAKQAQGLAGGVASSLQQIAEQLGGGVGSTAGVTIGVNNGNYHVNAVGGQIGKKGSGDVNFADDADAAVAFALQQLVAKGAVTGLSKAVAQALQSSADVNTALKEALKVRQLETLLGGVGAQIGQLFKDADALAADRVRIAKQYGLDLLKVEQINADARADLVASTLKNRVGALQDLLTNLTSGDLFEGDAATRRAALQKQIDAARVDADAGKDGAADTLAGLERQLVQTSRDAFGTAGAEYAADRDAAIADAQRIIDRETQRVADAAAATQATTDAVNAGNALMNEQNDLTVTTNQQLAAIYQAIAAGAGGFSPDVGLVARD